MRKLAWEKNGWDDYLYCGATPRRRKTQDKGDSVRRIYAHRWQSQDRKTLKKINKLIDSVLKTPFEGIGKPEPLKENLSGYWSRRINETDRLVYQVSDNYIVVISCRYHY